MKKVLFSGIAGGLSATFLLLLSSGSQALAQEKQPPGIRSLALSPDGKSLACGTGEQNQSGEAILWDLATRRPRWSHRGKTAIPSVAFSPDGKSLAIAVSDNTKLLDVATGQVLMTFRGHTKAVRGVAFSPDGKTLATASQDMTIKFWDLISGKEKGTLTGHNEGIYMLAFSPDGKRLVSTDGQARLWDVATGKTLHTLAHGNFVVRFALFAGDDFVLTAGYDGTARLWNSRTGQLRLRFQGLGGLDGAAYSRASGFLALCGYKEISLFELPLHAPGEKDQQRIRDLLERLDDDRYDVREAAGRSLAEIGLLAEPELYKALSESTSPEVRIRARRIRAALLSQPRAILEGHADAVECVAFSPDGKVLASGDKAGTIKLWDVLTRHEIATLAQPAINP